jgi:hypothetical protein
MNLKFDNIVSINEGQYDQLYGYLARGELDNHLDEKRRIEFAKFCAKKDANDTVLGIRRFKISDEPSLIKIAEICAQARNSDTAYHIERFGIKNKKALVDIAKLCLQRDIQQVNFLNKFQIMDQETLVELARFCAKSQFWMTAFFIGDFKIKSQQTLNELVVQCLSGDERVLHSLNNFSIDLDTNILTSEVENPEKMEILLSQLSNFIKRLPCKVENRTIIENVINDIRKLPFVNQKTVGKWYARFIILALYMDGTNLDWVFDSGLWRALYQLHDLALRSPLTPPLLALASSKDRIPLVKGKNGVVLATVSLFEMHQRGVPKSKLEQLSVLLSRKLKHHQDIKHFIQSVHLLSSTTLYTPEEKVSGFDRVFNSTNISDILQRLTAVRGLIQLEDKNWLTTEQDPVQYFRTFFDTLIPLQLFKGDVIALYEKYFMKSRQPLALITYAAGLKKLNEFRVISYLSEFVRSVFDETFKKDRYDTKFNAHLKKLAEVRPDLLDLWKEDEEVSIDSLPTETENKRVLDISEWVKTMLVDDKHLANVDLPFLTQYFECEARDVVVDALKEELKKATRSEEKQNHSVVCLKLQMACISLAQSKPKDVLDNLQKIDKLLKYKTIPSNDFDKSEFAHDIEKMIESYKKQFPESVGHLTATTTDDPIDLLLCGTEVMGSCQRIDGNPHVNKGLLGYIMDGKNRLLAIKDQQGKIIARCILRLLWDGEQPVLFRERLYPTNLSHKQERALNNLALKMSQKLGVPLTCKGQDPAQGIPLHALGCLIPYEYCDGCLGVQENGKYTINGAIIFEEISHH